MVTVVHIHFEQACVSHSDTRKTLSGIFVESQEGKKKSNYKVSFSLALISKFNNIEDIYRSFSTYLESHMCYYIKERLYTTILRTNIVSLQQSSNV